MGDIEQWLNNLGLGKYTEVFLEMEVDMEILPEITDTDLEKAGIPLGPRKKILKAIANPESIVSKKAETIQASTAERRQLTVMFCDLVGSTSLSERFDPEDLSDIIRLFQKSCENIINKYEGNIARYLGDGMLVYFGFPYAHEDDPERAIKAGLEIIEVVSQIDKFDLTLQTRIGIATGLVVVGEVIGEGSSMEQAVVGETPNLAARLQSVATPDSVVIGNNTWRLTDGMFECNDLGHHELKGFSDPVQAWQVVSEKSIESRYEATREGAEISPIQGREEEVEILQRRWNMAFEGKGQVVVLTGEAGIGKSRLIQALRDYIGEEPHSLLRFYGTPYNQNSALHPVIAQLERAAKIERTDSPESRLNKLETLLKKSNDDPLEVVSVFASMLSIETTDRYPDLGLSPALLKEKLMTTLEFQFNKLATERPVLAIFEDLHWVDPTTLEFLERTVNQIGEARVLIIVTGRPEFVAPWSSISNNTTLTLNRLDRESAKRLITKIAGGKSLPDSLVNIITDKTDCVPLFIEELTKTVLEADYLEADGDQYQFTLPSRLVPNTLRDSLMARLDRMTSVKEITQTAAVIGRVFSYEMLAEISDMSESLLQNSLQEAQDAGLIHRRGYPPEAQYTFKHALLQDAAYDNLLLSKRKSIHKKIAATLERNFTEIVEVEPELLAHHYTGADDAATAINYWQKAGQLAVSKSAYLESIAHCKRGLELLDQQPETTERNELELEFRALLGVGSVATLGYAADEIAKNYARAQEVCEIIGSTPRLIPTLYGLWVFHLLRGHRKDTPEIADQLYQYASDPDQPMVTSSAKAITCFFSGNRLEAQKYITAAMERFDAEKHDALAGVFGDDADLLPHFYNFWNLWLSGYPDQALVALDQARSEVENIGTPFLLGSGLAFEMVLWHELRDVATVASVAERNKKHCNEQGFLFYAAIGMMGAGWARVQQDQDVAGIDEIQQGLTLFRAIGSNLAASYYMHYLVEAHLVCGNLVEAMEVVDEALELNEVLLDNYYLPELCRLKGEILCREEKDIPQALEYFNKSIELAQVQDAKMLELRATISLCRVIKKNDKDRARKMLSEIIDWFTEGFENTDWKEANALLDELT